MVGHSTRGSSSQHSGNCLPRISVLAAESQRVWGASPGTGPADSLSLHMAHTRERMHGTLLEKELVFAGRQGRDGALALESGTCKASGVRGGKATFHHFRDVRGLRLPFPRGSRERRKMPEQEGLWISRTRGFRLVSADCIEILGHFKQEVRLEGFKRP